MLVSCWPVASIVYCLSVVVCCVCVVGRCCVCVVGCCPLLCDVVVYGSLSCIVFWFVVARCLLFVVRW